MIHDSPSFLDFIQLGVAHIGALASEWVGPSGVHLPDGIDHILFLLALVLAGGGIWKTLKGTFGFTIGHSISLALVSVGMFRPPSRWVEAGIALSIVYVAAQDLLRRGSRHREGIVVFFGLVHGFGFASALDGLALAEAERMRAWLGFTIGVELGQAILVTFMIVILSTLKAESLPGRVVIRGASLGVLMVGSYWFLARVFG